MSNYANRSKEELLELAADRGVPGRSSMTKDELVAALRDEGPDARGDTDGTENLKGEDPGASLVHPGTDVQPGQGADPTAREMPPPEIDGAFADELHGAVNALTAGVSGLFTYHASRPVITERGLEQLDELLADVRRTRGSHK